jgi:predicted DNA-binding transcriptional regulator AlpA
MRTTDESGIDPLLLAAVSQAVKQAMGDIPRRPADDPSLVMRIGEVAKTICLSQSTLRNLLDVHGRWYCPSFPRPICLSDGGGKRSSIGWRRVDIEAWVDSRPPAMEHQLDKTPSKAKPRRSQRKSIPYTPCTPGMDANQGVASSGFVSNRISSHTWKV